MQKRPALPGVFCLEQERKQKPSPANISGLGRRVWVCGTRCKYIHVSSFAPSMALYGPANPPPPAPDSGSVVQAKAVQLHLIACAHQPTVRGPAGVGLRGLCETWMFRKSLQGRIHGAPRKPAPARQLRQTHGQRLFAQMHEATGRSPVPRYTMQSDTPKAIGAPKGPRCFGQYSEKPPQRRPVSLRAMTRRWISEVPS